MGRPTDDYGQKVTTNNLEQALATLEQNRPDLIEPETLEPTDSQLFEADGDLAPTKPHAEPEAETRIGRDAFGNRERVVNADPEAMAPKELKVLVDMYSLPRNLARPVLLGKLDFATARAIQLRRRRGDRTGGIPMHVRVILALAAVAALLILVRLF